MSQAMDSTAAQIISVPKQYRGQITGGWTDTLSMVIFYFQLALVLVVTFGPMGLLAWFAHENFQKQLEVELGFAVVGLVIGVAGAWWMVSGMLKGGWASIFVLNQVKSVLGLRPDPLFNLDDPDLVYVEFVPYANIGSTHCKPDDLGLLKLDRKSQTLLFEMDNRRYVVPLPSIASLNVDVVKQSTDPRVRPVIALVMRIRVADEMGARELIIFPIRFAGGKPIATTLQARAQWLHDNIYALHQGTY